MAISTEIVGKEFGPFVREYTFKDLEICALGCNAGYDGKTDLEYVNEGDAATARCTTASRSSCTRPSR